MATVAAVEVLSSRVLLRPSDFEGAVDWYRDTLGLRVAREYGAGGRVTGVVFFLGGGFLELAGAAGPGGPGATLWLQVPDVDGEHARLARAGADIARPPVTEPWGLRECWVTGPDDARIVLVQVPATHPLRRRVE